MNEQVLVIRQTQPVTVEPQDVERYGKISQIFGGLLSLIVVAVALYKTRSLDLARIEALLPSSAGFWALFALTYLSGPAGDWVIYRRLWGVGPGAFVPLVRKFVYNELLVSYLGEVYFYDWARRHLTFSASPFGAVKDVAILSAQTGNLITLALLAMAFPQLSLLPWHNHAHTIAGSLLVLVATSSLIMLMRNSIFTLDRDELIEVALLHSIRLVLGVVLMAMLWHFVLPGVALQWWLLLAALRMLITRLPLIPNKDIVFAGVAVLFLGSQVEMAALVTMMAGLFLITHASIGAAFVVWDFVRRPSPSTSWIRQ